MKARTEERSLLAPEGWRYMSAVTTRNSFSVSALVVIGLLACCPAAFAQQADEIFYQCYGRTQAGIGGASPLFCQCVNDRATEVLNTTDLAKARADYSYLQVLEQNRGEPYSYQRYASLIHSHCVACKEKNYRDCLPDGQETSFVGPTEIMMIHMEDAQFDLIERGTAYENFFVDIINVVGDTCPALVRNPIEIWVETLTDGEVTNTTDRLRLDQRIHTRYKTYANRRSLRASNQMTRDIERSRRTGQLPMGGFSTAMDMAQQRQEMFSLMGTDCSPGGRIDRAYRNVLSFELGDPAVSPEGAPRRITAPVRDPARLERVANAVKEAREAALAQRMAAGPLRCSWEPEEVNGTQQPEANGHASIYSMLEEYAGSYTVQFGGEYLDMGIWNRSDLPGVLGIGNVRGTECAVVLTIQSGLAGRHQVQFNFSRVSGSANASACRETAAFPTTSLIGFGTLGKPGESIPLFLNSIPWVQQATGVCEDEVTTLTPTKLSSDTVSFLKEAQETQWRRYPGLKAPDSFWQTVTK